MKFIDRKELYDGLAVNENLEVKTVKVEDMEYLFIENFLKDIDKAKSILDNYPAINGGVYTPGARQNFTSVDLAPIVSAYGQLLEKDPTKFLTSSIIVRKGMKVWDNSWMPHTDYGTVCNLWLNDYNGGTAFYRHKKETPPKGMTFNKKNLVDWKSFEGNEDWELFHIIPSKKNTLAIYDGTKYHGAYTTLTEETRWSLISFYQEGDRTYQ